MNNLEHKILDAFNTDAKSIELTASEFISLKRMIYTDEDGCWKIMPNVYFNEAEQNEVLTGKAYAYLANTKTHSEITLTVVADSVLRPELEKIK